MLRLVSWNIRRTAEAWRELVRDVDLDIALLQEALPPPPDVAVETAPSGSESWCTAGGRRSFCAAVAKFGTRTRFTPITSRPMTEADDRDLAVSRQGSIAAADVEFANGEHVTVASLYAAWERPREGHWIYADASAHRLVSDLSVFVGSQRDHRIIAAGDLNILMGHGENGSPYWRDRYLSIFSRMAAIGLPFAGPQHPNGIQADPWPSELPSDSKNVPTFRVRQSEPATATRQLDFVFASAELHHRLRVRALNSCN
ncbi:MAG: hypothetical protein HYY06_31415 [Deltaproteobacteria bacterium]|nr:hypothetical protein [Deltaproteobacteria bacterium]